MSKLIRSVPALLAALIVAVAAPAPAGAAMRSTPAAQHARLGGRGFGARPRLRAPGRRPYRAPASRTRRRSPFHGFFGGVLKVLGLAYLAHLLFGLGAGGGSPLGLLIVLGVVVWLMSRTRRHGRPLSY